MQDKGIAKQFFKLELFKLWAYLKITGEKNNLAYVSPRTGRAVTSSAGSPYRDKLLVLPKFVVDSAFQNSVLSRNDIAAGLKLTGWFISRHLLSERKIKMPAARGRLAKRWEVLP